MKTTTFLVDFKLIEIDSQEMLKETEVPKSIVTADVFLMQQDGT